MKYKDLDLTSLFDAIKEDYRKFFDHSRDNFLTATHEKMIAEFNSTLGITEMGKKYLRVVKNKGEHSESVWGFVVMEDDGKFQKGDVLKAASYKAPAKNKARGRIDDSDLSWVKWTGAI